MGECNSSLEGPVELKTLKISFKQGKIRINFWLFIVALLVGIVIYCTQPCEYSFEQKILVEKDFYGGGR